MIDFMKYIFFINVVFPIHSDRIKRTTLLNTDMNFLADRESNIAIISKVLVI